MHQILTSNRDYLAFVKERGKIRAAQAKFHERQVKAERAYAARLTEYRLDQEACLLRGEAPGYKKPEPPQLEGQAQVFQSELMRIDAAERAWLGRRADDIVEALLDRESEILAESAQLLARLDTLVAEANLARETAQTVTVAAGGAGQPILGHPVTFERLNNAARANRSLIVSAVPMRTSEGGVVSLPMNLDSVDIDHG
jgi:hypothetical protein